MNRTMMLLPEKWRLMILAGIPKALMLNQTF